MTALDDRPVIEPGHPYADFCLWPYDPPADPTGKLRSDDLLRRSLELEGVAAEGTALCDRLRTELGPGRTVWGIKHERGRISWELYFYDYRRQARSASAERILAAMGPHIRCDVRLNEEQDWFMFSVDLTAAILTGRAPVEELSVYIDNPAFDGNAGLSYSINANWVELRNVYYFYEAARRRREIGRKLRQSIHVRNDTLALAWERMDGMRGDSFVVVANKRRNDGLYYTRVNVDGLRAFLKWAGFPRGIVDHVDTNRDRLDHLLTDVGFDFRAGAEGTTITKCAVYGSF